MDKEIRKQIEEAILPQLLKDYFLRNHHIHLYINESLLAEIEESYIEYDTLYEFDETDFCTHVITGIHKQDKHEYFYHYLKKVLDNNLIRQSKSKKTNYSQLKELEQTIINLPERYILAKLKVLLMTMQKIRKSEAKEKEIFLAYTLVGHLEMLFILYPNNIHKKDYEVTVNNLIQDTQ